MIHQLEELIRIAQTSLTKAGHTADYVKHLAYTWSEFLSYHTNNPGELTREYGNGFLHERYGIPPDVTKLNTLRPSLRRRKRAIEMLFRCMAHQTPFPVRSYWECNFIEPFADYFTSFLNDRKRQNFSLPTINRDIYSLNRFSEYLSKSSIETIGAIKGEVVAGFIRWLSGKTGLPTVKSVASTLRLFFKFLSTEGHLAYDLSITVPKVRVHRDVPSTYTSAEIESMLDNMTGSSKVDIRNYAMVILAVRLGMRASDICGLQLKDIDWRKNEIAFISTKTNKHTVLPLSADVGNAIIRYLKEARQDDANPHLFLRYQKPYRELLPPSMHRMVSVAMRNAGIIIPYGRRHGPHALRASLASNMLRNNTPLPVISEILSHSSTDTTRIYLKVDFDNLRRISLDVPPLKGVWMGGVTV
jgi:site-specific recombinase XerD